MEMFWYVAPVLWLGNEPKLPLQKIEIYFFDPKWH